jgi:hypothetical protein
MKSRNGLIKGGTNNHKVQRNQQREQARARARKNRK